MSDLMVVLAALNSRKKRRRFYPRNRVYRPRISFLSLTEEQVFDRFRLNKQFIYDLCEELKGDLECHRNSNYALPVPVKMTSALTFYATGSFQNAASGSTGISQASMCKSLSEVTEALVRRVKKYICFPLSSGQMQKTREEFYKVAQFPNVLGVIDCTHVAIRARTENEPAFRNSKGFHSVNVQVVCDAKNIITNVLANHPGCADDAYILSKSRLTEIFETEITSDCWLVGDSAYDLKPWLMTPIPNPESPAEHRYKEAHQLTHAVIDKTKRILKTRFRCLDRSRGVLQYSPKKVCQIFLACCVLHNIATRHNILVDVDEGLETPNEDEDMSLSPDEDEELPEENTSSEAASIRMELVREHFS